jgi:type IV secretory pathway VirB4 component
LVLDDPAFAQQLREWLKTLRKKNASVVFAPQSLSDIAAPPQERDLLKMRRPSSPRKQVDDL